MDRFFMRIRIGYPSVEEETDILERYCGGSAPMKTLEAVCTAEDIMQLQSLVGNVYCSREVRAYAASIAAATRAHNALQLGVSPRGTIALVRAAQACALLSGRDYIIPDDVRQMVFPVLSHRLMLTP